MKTPKRLFQLLPICMIIFGFYACDEIGLDDILPGKEKEEFIIWDFSPINLHFTVTSEDGEDLLNPNTPGSYAGLNTTATFEEKTYVKDVFEDNHVPYGRAYLPHMYGIYTTQLNDGRYALKFGELDGAGNYEDAAIVLNWGDNTQDVITFSSSITWKDNKPQSTRIFKLNGETAAENTITPVIEIKKKAIQSPNKELALDVSPIVLNIYLTDTLGGNLFNKLIIGPNSNNDVKAIFKGQEYHVNKVNNNEKSDGFTGLTLSWSNSISSLYPLKFGELDGTETYEDENLIMDWGSLGKDTITFTSKIEWVDNRPTFIRRYSINGEEIENNTSHPNIRIRK